MLPTSSGPRRYRVVAALCLTALVMMTVPSAAVTASGLEIDLSASEDVIVKNSDLGLTVSVRDATTGEPVTGCDVVLHIERKASGDGNGDHMHGEPLAIPDGVPVPTVDIEVAPDPKSGWNLHVVTTDFRFAPENASTDHRNDTGSTSLES